MRYIPGFWPAQKTILANHACRVLPPYGTAITVIAYSDTGVFKGAFVLDECNGAIVIRLVGCVDDTSRSKILARAQTVLERLECVDPQVVG